MDFVLFWLTGECRGHNCRLPAIVGSNLEREHIVAAASLRRTTKEVRTCAMLPRFPTPRGHPRTTRRVNLGRVNFRSSRVTWDGEKRMDIDLNENAFMTEARTKFDEQRTGMRMHPCGRHRTSRWRSRYATVLQRGASERAKPVGQRHTPGHLTQVGARMRPAACHRSGNPCGPWFVRQKKGGILPVKPLFSPPSSFCPRRDDVDPSSYTCQPRLVLVDSIPSEP
ncbi:hypothetical protein QBC47DRAFT_68456 [Echria macrotheca]|uniref:Uncharacterized protein n=1 Tax=Echria macrotheca TaxID=438768 RepID=A0AAJ0B874_9PEZI|nr:hypothetical protein QBC47DRAFT_68456 [Echria macrotheca]